jgi:hypothetical protein
MSDTEPTNDVKPEGEMGEPITIRVRDQVREKRQDNIGPGCHNMNIFAHVSWASLWLPVSPSLCRFVVDGYAVALSGYH